MAKQVSREDREELMGIISDPGKRQALRANPQGAKKGGDVDELVDILAGMSDAELDAVTKLNQKMVEKGFTEKDSMILARAV